MDECVLSQGRVGGSPFLCWQGRQKFHSGVAMDEQRQAFEALGPEEVAVLACVRLILEADPRTVAALERWLQAARPRDGELVTAVLELVHRLRVWRIEQSSEAAGRH